MKLKICVITLCNMFLQGYSRVGHSPPYSKSIIVYIHIYIISFNLIMLNATTLQVLLLGQLLYLFSKNNIILIKIEML